MSEPKSDPVKENHREATKQVLVEEPATTSPDVAGDKPQTFRFDDWALI